MSVDQEAIDEVLEAIWVARESKKASIEHIQVAYRHDGHEIDMNATVDELARLNLVKLEADTIDFLPEGEELAEAIIRRHRLAERLFTDVLHVSETSMEMTACHFEHILNPEVTESVCAFLGHPPLCPHGKPIPPGECCKTFQRNEMRPLVVRLVDVELGKEGTIAFITPSFHKSFDRLTALGVIAGSPITVHQREPSFVVRIGETELAIDRTIARDIYVKAP